ncbi:MAG: DUF5660 family protein, partial [Microgenomates group bacterium]
MNAQGNKKLASSFTGSGSANPFARALAESEKTSDKSGVSTNPFSEALAKTGGNFGDNAGGPLSFEQWQKSQEAELKRKRNNELLKKKLHDKVNPVDTRDVFNAREREVKREIEQLQKDLMALSREVKKFHKEVDLAVVGNVPDPGLTGAYHKGFFSKLRAFIILLTKQVRSARTWLHQSQAKQGKKKKKRTGPG